MSLAIRTGRASVRQAVKSRLRSRSPLYLLPRSSGMRSRGAGSKASSRRSQPCPAARGSPPGPALVGPARRDLLPFRRARVVPQQRAGTVGSRAGLGARGEASPPRQPLQEGKCWQGASERVGACCRGNAVRKASHPGKWAAARAEGSLGSRGICASHCPCLGAGGQSHGPVLHQTVETWVGAPRL